MIGEVAASVGAGDGKDDHLRVDSLHQWVSRGKRSGCGREGVPEAAFYRRTRSVGCFQRTAPMAITITSPKWQLREWRDVGKLLREATIQGVSWLAQGSAG
jgi:hypothetical protein